VLRQCSAIKIICVGTKGGTNLFYCTIESELHRNPMLERPEIRLQLNYI